MRWHPSPNFGQRRDGLKPAIVVLHYTAMNSFEAACARLCDPGAEVSAHYLIGRTGEVLQLVQEDQRAWHAGEGSWRGQGDVNSRSIGIELDNTGQHPFAEPQMRNLETLLWDILRRWSIAPADVIGHSDMAPGRKHDPGPRFDWARLARQGLAQRSGTGAKLDGPATMEAFRRRAHRAGYPAGIDDATLLAAVRARFRPAGNGALSADDLLTLPDPA